MDALSQWRRGQWLEEFVKCTSVFSFPSFIVHVVEESAEPWIVWQMTSSITGQAQRAQHDHIARFSIGLCQLICNSSLHHLAKIMAFLFRMLHLRISWIFWRARRMLCLASEVARSSEGMWVSLFISYYSPYIANDNVMMTGRIKNNMCPSRINRPPTVSMLYFPL